jgi:hypothetical protein
MAWKRRQTVHRAGVTLKALAFTERNMPYLAAMILVTMNFSALADGFRCNSALVLTGDPVSRLSQACGPPRERLKARIEHVGNGRQDVLSVTQWIYERRGRKPIVVSVHNGRVIRIDRG